MDYKARTRLYVGETRFEQGGVVDLNERAAHYLRNVLRMALGDHLAVFNGLDGEWRAEISAIGKKGAQVTLLERIGPQESVPDLWLAFAPIKRDRIDFLVEKATELGVAKMMPVLTRRTNVDRVNLERLRAHAIEAAEQCGRTLVPEIMEPLRLDQFLDRCPDDRHIMYCDEMLGEGSAVSALKNKGHGAWVILTGPEGGFDAGERQVLHTHKACVPISLGPRILRADTAALAAITLWQSVLGDW